MIAPCLEPQSDLNAAEVGLKRALQGHESRLCQIAGEWHQWSEPRRSAKIAKAGSKQRGGRKRNWEVCKLASVLWVSFHGGPRGKPRPWLQSFANSAPCGQPLKPLRPLMQQKEARSRAACQLPVLLGALLRYFVFSETGKKKDNQRQNEGPKDNVSVMGNT